MPLAAYAFLQYKQLSLLSNFRKCIIIMCDVNILMSDEQSIIQT